QSSKMAVGIFFAVLFLLFMPFPILAYSAFFAGLSTSFGVLSGAALFASGLFYLGSTMDAKKGLGLGFRHALFAPLGSVVIISGFASGILQAKKNNAVTWRGRTYSISNTKQNPISL
ncbi:MAG TPA: glycosyl transferase, partial [Candidatus Nitrosotalea sp.]|nr:glycosyl transferase [Candidatus Nitrosotalea sp.]